MRLIRRHPLCPNAKTVATLKHHRKARLFFQSFGKCIRVIGQRKFKDNCTICILCFGVEFKPVRNDIGSIFLCCVPPKRCSYSRIYSALAARVPVYDARQTAPMIRAHSPMFKMQRPCPIHTDTLNNTPRGIHVYLINLCGLWKIQNNAVRMMAVITCIQQGNGTLRSQKSNCAIKWLPCSSQIQKLVILMRNPT